MSTPDGPPPIPPPLPPEAFTRGPLTPPPLPPQAMAPAPSVIPEVVELTRQRLALVLTQRKAECESLLRRALTLAETNLGENHAVTADCLTNLGDFLSQNGRCEAAEPLLRRAVAAAEASQGASHVKTGTACNNLALMFKRAGQFAEAEPLFRRALDIFAKAGPDTIEVASVLNNLAAILERNGRNAEAESNRRYALDLFIRHFGPDHENVAIALNNLARLLADTGRAAEAEPLSRRHLEIFVGYEQRTGNQHAYLVPAANGYGELLTKLGLTMDAARERIQTIIAGRDPGNLPGAQPAAPASAEPDFDALARTASSPNAGQGERDALYASVFRLEAWQFVARGELPDVQPYFCTNAGVADGAPMVKAFTDGRRLHAFAKENGLLQPDGQALSLSLKVKTILPMMLAYAEQGILSIHFNADRASDGFYAPLVQLPTIRRHLEERGLL